MGASTFAACVPVHERCSSWLVSSTPTSLGYLSQLGKPSSHKMLSQTEVATWMPTFLATIMAITAALLYRLTTNRKQNLPPGPRGLPLIGNLADFIDSNLIKRTCEWGSSYGHVIKLRLGLHSLVVLSSVEAVTEAYIQHGTDFASKPRMSLLAAASDQGEDIAFAPYSEGVRYRRKIAMQALRLYLSGTPHSQKIHRLVQDMIPKLLSQGAAFSFHPYVRYMTLNIMHEICFGHTLSMDSVEYKQLFANVRTSSSGPKTWQWCIPGIRYITAEAKKKRVTIFLDYVKKQLEARAVGAERSHYLLLMDHIITAHKQVDDGEDETLKSGFTFVHVTHLIRQVIVAGILATNDTLDWVFLLLAAKQDVQGRIQAEIDRVVGTDTPIPEHRAAMVYTEAFILEVMRMYPGSPMGLEHETLRDTQVGGYDIPAGTRVMANFYAILNDPRHWENPDKFLPERFMHEDETKLKARSKSWIPFGIGPRQCIGEMLARQNIFYSVVALLQNLNFHLAPGTDEQNLLTPQNLSFSIIPRPYKVLVTRRVR